MQFTVERHAFLRAVGQVSGVPKAKSDIPILMRVAGAEQLDEAA